MTDRRERPFNPTFGAGLRSRLFEQIAQSSLEDIKQSLISQIENNFPNVSISDLNVNGDPNTSSIRIKFSYTLKSSKETDGVVLEIQNA